MATIALPSLAQDFYREQLENGRQALAAQRYEDAVTHLDIACFGMMENPARRVGCKVYLFLAQRRTGDAVSATETLRLIARLEERFAAYSGASLDADTRRMFLLETDASGIDLSVWPRLQRAVAGVVGTAEATAPGLDSLSPAQLERALKNDPANSELATRLVVSQYRRGKFADVQTSAEELLSRDPDNATASCLLAVATATRNRSMCPRTLEAIEACSSDLQDRRYARTRLQCYVDLERWQDGRAYSDRLPENLRNNERRLVRVIERQSTATAAPSTGTVESPPETPTPRASTEASVPEVEPDQGEIESLRRRQTQAIREGDVAAIADILDRTSQLADEQPSNGPLRELAGQAAYLLSRWDEALFHLEAADQLHELGAFSLFYLATAQAETGDTEAARNTLRRSLTAGLPQAPQVTALEQKLRTGA